MFCVLLRILALIAPHSVRPALPSGAGVFAFSALFAVRALLTVPVPLFPFLALLTRIEMAPQRMPLRGSSRAPEFDGDATELVRFFEDVEILCEGAELYSDAERIKWATRYASRSEAELWSILASRSGADWPAFMAEVKRFYPGAEDDDRKYIRSDLDRLVVAQASIPMSSRRELGEYIRKFTVIASFLEKKGRLSKGEREDKFLAGFHPVFKGQLMSRLTLAYLEHHPDDPWPTDRVVQHASFLLAGVSMATPEVVTASPELRPASVSAPTAIKREYYSAGLSRSFAPGPRPQAPRAYAPIPMGLAPTPVISALRHVPYVPLVRSLSPQCNEPCCFCGVADGHRVDSCITCNEYVRVGKCQRRDGQIVLADGAEIPRGPFGQTAQERIDSWCAMRANMTASLVQERPPVQESTHSEHFGHAAPPRDSDVMFLGLDAEEDSEDLDEEDREALARAYARVEEVRRAMRLRQLCSKGPEGSAPRVCVPETARLECVTRERLAPVQAPIERSAVCSSPGSLPCAPISSAHPMRNPGTFPEPSQSPIPSVRAPLFVSGACDPLPSFSGSDMRICEPVARTPIPAHPAVPPGLGLEHLCATDPPVCALGVRAIPEQAEVLNLGPPLPFTETDDSDEMLAEELVMRPAQEQRERSEGREGTRSMLDPIPQVLVSAHNLRNIEKSRDAISVYSDLEESVERALESAYMFNGFDGIVSATQEAASYFYSDYSHTPEHLVPIQLTDPSATDTAHLRGEPPPWLGDLYPVVRDK